ncbi:MAG: sugar nucleotide-binding protein [Phycisphaerae bacterium]|nr:sugar nucleotide-binding protein [Phycisphaerae bacterium]
MKNNKQRILVTGITSIHGWPIWKALRAAYGDGQIIGVCPPATRGMMDDNVIPMCITDRAKLEEIRETFAPTCVVHCAGVCDLDICQERPQWAYDINTNGMKAVTGVFSDRSRIIYMSTDLVFSGNEPPARGYTETHAPDPVSVAGETFSQAEEILLRYENSCIIRLGLPLGDSVTGTKGAIDWIKGRLLKNRPVTLFYDEYRSCPECGQIGEMALAVLSLDLRGLYHFGGNRSWQLYEIGQYVLEKYKCAKHLLKGISRHEEVDGPPRIGDVSMNCEKLKGVLNDAGIVVSGFNEL